VSDYALEYVLRSDVVSTVVIEACFTLVSVSIVSYTCHQNSPQPLHAFVDVRCFILSIIAAIQMSSLSQCCVLYFKCTISL